MSRKSRGTAGSILRAQQGRERRSVREQGTERVVADLAISLLVILAGAVSMLMLLVAWFGGKAIAPEFEDDLDPILGSRNPMAIHDTQSPFIPMPAHLKTNDQMVEWMTRELPKLTAEIANPRG
jgi:hypothetical protein